MSPRLWVTGLGLVTPLGTGVEATWTRLVRGDRALRPVTLFDASEQRVGIAGEVDDVEVPAPDWSRTSAMAATAAEEALRWAGLLPAMGEARSRPVSRVGLVVGGTTGGMFETEQLLARLHAEPECREVLAAMLSHPLTATGARLDERLGPFARIRTLCSACSSGANAVVVAAGWLLRGDVDAVLAGGSDGLCRLTLSGFNALGALDANPCSPFDLRRRGTSLGEGAGFLLIERADAALARGARPVAELAGWALGSEAHHITNPAPDGAVVASLVERALMRAGLTSRDVDYVNAHGTATLLNDPMEAAALASAFGGELARIPVASSKGQIGHTLGAAGAIEAAITALVVSRRVLAPTAGLDQPDPSFGLTHVPHQGRPVPRVRAALSNAFGFGGMDTVLLFADAARENTAPSHREIETALVVTGAAIFGPCGRLGTEECAGLLDRRHDPSAMVDPDAYLDPVRARRLDRASRLGAVVVEWALKEAGGGTVGTGLVLGSAFGNVDGSAAYMHRIFEKGSRFASPGEFPSLVPSSPVGHISIYLGLRGPSFATADLATSGESAFVQALQLVAVGEAPRVVAGAVEPKSDIVERVLAELFAQGAHQAGAGRSDLAAAIVVETEAEALRRGARFMARVRQVLEWRGDGSALTELGAPRSNRAEVVVARDHPDAQALLLRSAWGSLPRRTCALSLGESDGLGALAIAVATGRIATGRVDEALILGLGDGRGYAIVLARS